MERALILPPVFSDGAILQSEAYVKVWGKCSCGKVFAEIDGEISEAGTKNGGFEIWLKPHKKEKNLTLRIWCEKEEKIIQDVCYGEVWLALGQSNMNVGLECSTNGCLAMQLTNADIRCFVAPRKTEDTESGTAYDMQQKKKVSLKWEKNGGSYTPFLSAIGFVFARCVSEFTDTAVGIIDCSRGATSILHWLPEADIKGSPVTADYFTSDAALFEKADYKKLGICILQPHCTYYNTMLKEVTGYCARGALWYQGEADAGGKLSAKVYKAAFKLLTKMLRRENPNRELPIITTQIASYARGWIGGGSGKNWAYFRAAQEECASEKEKIYMVTAIDAGESENIHPKNKTAVGERMACCALCEVYGYNIKWKAPRIKCAYYENGEVCLETEFAYGTLRLTDKSAKSGFEAKESGGRWQRVDFRIQGEKIYLNTLKSSIRYNFKNNPKHCIYNYCGLPLLPVNLMNVSAKKHLIYSAKPKS